MRFIQLRLIGAHFLVHPWLWILASWGKTISSLIIIFKCCGDGIIDFNNESDEEKRRYDASNFLKEYIDTNLSDKNVIVLGDLNDDIAEAPQNNVFQMILDDPENYLFADLEIANGSTSEWSCPTWPSHLDHILITNELFDELGNSDIQTIKN